MTHPPRVRPSPLAWVADEKERFVAQARSTLATLEIEVVEEEGSTVMEIMFSLRKPGLLDGTIQCELRGMLKAQGWRLQATFPARTGTERPRMNAGSTAQAVATVGQWARAWVARAGLLRTGAAELERGANAEQVAVTQEMARRIRTLVEERLGLQSMSIPDLVLAIDDMATRALDADEADAISPALRRLFEGNVPLSGVSIELVATALDISVLWLLTGTGSPIPDQI